jgi:hypothetical protein
MRRQPYTPARTSRKRDLIDWGTLWLACIFLGLCLAAAFAWQVLP